MSRRKISRAYLCGVVALLATLPLLSSTALAQVAPPPVRQPVDNHGIDLLAGTYSSEGAILSLGAGASMLSYQRTLVNGVWRPASIGAINKAGGVFTVSVGSESEVFTQVGSTFTNDQGSGSTLSLDAGGLTYSYVTRSGVHATFDRTFGVGNQFASEAALTDLKPGSGLEIKYTWKRLTYCVDPGEGGGCREYASASRLQSVGSNFGYQIKFSYATNTLDETDVALWQTVSSVMAINNAVDYCDPTADTCTGLTQSWPTISYATTTSGGNTLETETDSAGRVLQYRYNSANYLIGIKLPASSSDDIVLTYDGSGRVVSFSIASGTWTYGYTISGSSQTTTITDPSSHAQTAQFDLSVGQMTMFTNALGYSWSYTYDGNGRLTQAKAPEGNHSDYTYDAYGNPLTTILTSKDGTQTISTSAVFGNCPGVGCGLATSTTDAASHTTTYSYNAFGQITGVIRPAPSSGMPQPETHYEYTSLAASYKQSAGAAPTAGTVISLPTKVTACRTSSYPCAASDQVISVLTYNNASGGSNLTPATTSAGAGDGSLTAVNTYGYDPIGNLTSIDGPLPGSADTTLLFFDASRLPLGSIGPDPDGAGALKNRATRNSYNGNGWITAVESGTASSYAAPLSSMSVLQRTETSYDNIGRVITSAIRDTSSSSLIALTQANYDASGNLQCNAIRMNPAAFSSLPSDACALGISGSYGPDRITKATYDAAGQLTLIQQAFGTSDVINYATTGYSPNGQVQSVTDANGNVSTYLYDGFDRTQSTHFPNPSGGGTSTTDFEQVLAYDANSNATSFRLRDGNTIAMTYDALNRLTGRTGATISGRTFTYDNLGETTGVTLTGGASATFTYDALGRATAETSTVGTFTHGYDLAGRQISLTWPDGFTISYSRLLTGELQAATESSGYVPVSFGYDDLGRRTAFTKANGHSQTYSYDAASRLTALSLLGLAGGTTTTYLYYNPASQAYARSTSDEQLDSNVAYNVSRNYVANGLNQYTKAGAPGLSHDTLGNLTRLASTTYAYDGDNLLTGGSAGTGLAYDPLARLAQLPDAGGTRLGYASGLLAAEYNMGGAVQHRYVPGDFPDEVLVQYEGAGYSRLYLATDERGSVTEVSDDSGATKSINQYDDWGIPARNNLGRFGYTGQTWLPSVQAWNYKARIYNPVLGRFQQTDPIGSEPHLYRYAANDPVNSADPSGLQASGDGGEIVVTAQQGGGPVTEGIFNIDTYGTLRGPGADNDKATPDDGVIEVRARCKGAACDPPLTHPEPIIIDIPQIALNDLPSLPQDSSQAGQCQLAAPSGSYKPSPGTIALFQPPFLKKLNAGIKMLNNQGITPVFTDGYRTQAMQNARRRSASSGSSPYGAAQGFSAHQVGLAADFGPGSNPGNSGAIFDAMTGAGLKNGASFSPSDPVHYVQPGARQSQNKATAASCAAAFAGH